MTKIFVKLSKMLFVNFRVALISIHLIIFPKKYLIFYLQKNTRDSIFSVIANYIFNRNLTIDDITFCR